MIEQNQFKKTPPFKVALVGHPNCGKTALFNALTGGRAKVGNYPGVTVERKEGMALPVSSYSDSSVPDANISRSRALNSESSSSGASDLRMSILDLPGIYSLDAKTLDEMITRDVLFGQCSDESSPDYLVAVADATNLERTLSLVIELRDHMECQNEVSPDQSESLNPTSSGHSLSDHSSSAYPRPILLALNMMDLAKERGIHLDLDILSRELKIPVVPTVATKKQGIQALVKEIQNQLFKKKAVKLKNLASTVQETKDRFAEVDRILSLAIRSAGSPTHWTDRIDHFVLHPVWGSLILVLVFGLIFQVIFTWARIPMEWIESGIDFLGLSIGHVLSDGPLKSLLVDGIIPGVGSVLVFLPQILLLFLFILFLEDSGYMPRAAFLMDRMMGRVGLHGRAFIPLLSSFACAIPGIMATRTIENRRDRLATILIAPLMTCSARIPIYSLLIAAFIPNILIFGPIRLQGLVMLGLYLAGIFIALTMALIFRASFLKGPKPHLLMELPSYKWPSILNISIGLLDRAKLFIKNAGTVILTVSILLWFLASYPKAPENAPGPAISYSYAGQIGKAIEPIVRPIGFNWKIAVALIPGFAAREVMVGSLATVYAVENKTEGDASTPLLATQLSKEWSVATALSLLVWYVIACQCLSTLAVTRRETNSWRWPAFMLSYLTALAYFGSFVTYHLALKLGLG